MAVQLNFFQFWTSGLELPKKIERVNWPRKAEVLDLYLEGHSYAEIGRRMGMSRQNAKIVCHKAARQLAHRVFYGVRRRYGGTGAYTLLRGHTWPEAEPEPEELPYAEPEDEL